MPDAADPMRVAVFGLGYVGSVTAACLAHQGHTVTGVELDATKLAQIERGESPILEPGLNELVAEGRRNGLLKVTSDAAAAVRSSDVTVVCVGTPSKPNGDLDLSYVEHVADDIGRALAGREDFHAVVFRSTMLPGSVERHLVPLLERASGRRADVDFGVAMCPEFLREASGVADFYDPPFVVAGVREDRTRDLVQRLFTFGQTAFHPVDVVTAETLKYSCNAFHALKVSFANEMGRFCQANDADARRVMEIFCEDDRLNLSSYYLRPGFSFGGSCLPKDLRALLHRARAVDVDLPLLGSVLASNQQHLRSAVDWVLGTGRRQVALLGLSFKSGTDDLRESPFVEVAESLLGKGIELRIYDENINHDRLVGSNRAYVKDRLPHLDRLLTRSAGDALEGVDCVLVATSSPDVAAEVARRRPRHVLDLCGRLGAEVEALPGYAGVAW